MAKKSTKTAREDQYREILAKAGIRFEDCRVLAFTFERPLGPETFHLHLMNADPRPEYHLFDCWEKTAQIIIPNDEPTAARVQESKDIQVKRKFDAIPGFVCGSRSRGLFFLL